VIDARDVLSRPERMLRRLCEAVGVAFLPQMLSWPAGPRPTDGTWARDWYAEVLKSTGFRSYTPRDESLPAELEELHARCREYYEMLGEDRLVGGDD
jgi:hypothetical protein